MPNLAYIAHRFSPASVAVIQQANIIITDYAAQGFDLTLRQLYYQFVSRGLIPNRDSEYKKLGSTINDARLAGVIDWNAIQDRTRNVRSLSRLRTYIKAGQVPIIFHLGDHDPSGIDMTRDITDRLTLFLRGGYDPRAGTGRPHRIGTVGPEHGASQPVRPAAEPRQADGRTRGRLHPHPRQSVVGVGRAGTNRHRHADTGRSRSVPRHG